MNKFERYISKNISSQALEIAKKKTSFAQLDYSGEIATGKENNEQTLI
jgi:hypothetical protein